MKWSSFPKNWPHCFNQMLRPGCFNAAYFASLVYETAVAMQYDLLAGRKDDAARRLEEVTDLLPEIGSFKDLTTVEERQELMKRLGEVRREVERGAPASDAAGRFVSLYAETLWSMIVRCQCPTRSTK